MSPLEFMPRLEALAPRPSPQRAGLLRSCLAPASASGRVPVATNGCFAGAEPKRGRSEHRAALEKADGRVWVEMTRPRATASKHRTSDVSFPAASPRGRPSQLDPQQPVVH